MSLGKPVDVIDHSGTYGEQRDNRGVVIRHGVDATTCGHCGRVITILRIATADEVTSHKAQCRRYRHHA